VIDNLPLEVTDDSGGSYTLSFSADVTGDIYGQKDDGVNVTEFLGTLARTTLTGTIEFDQTTLGITAINALLDGSLRVDVKKNGASILPFLFPIPATIDMNVVMDQPYVLVDFPMNTSKIWGLSANNITLDGTIQSIWLNIINLIDTLMVLFLPDGGLIPPEYKHLFPVIDISEVFDILGYVQPMNISGLPGIFACFGNESVTVTAGTYDAYNITMLGGLGIMFYAPGVKNIIKIEGAFAEELPYISDIEMELISTNVS
jgi:hypothetical protein